MSTIYEIPLITAPQKFAIALGGVTYNFVFTYRDASTNLPSGWVLDIYDIANSPLACGIPLVTGCDLLSQLDYLGFTGLLAISSDGDPWSPPTFTNLGTNSHLYYVSP